MSDFASSLPIRTENNGDAVVLLADGTITSQTASVDSNGSQSTIIKDSSGNAVTSQTSGSQQALDVGINVAGVQVDPRAIRALTSADVVTANQGAPNTDANKWPVSVTDGTDTLSITAAGEATVSVTQPLPTGSNTIGSVGVTNLPATVDTNFGAVGASTIRVAAEPGNASGLADFNNGATGAQTLRVAANLAVAGANVTAANPVPVSVVSSVPGTKKDDFKDASAIAAGASDNHDYTVTAGLTLTLNQIEASASGKAKMEVQVETGVATNTFTTKFVQFNSTAAPNMSVHIDDPISVAAGVRVRVIMTNKDNQAQDLYSTICGSEA